MREWLFLVAAGLLAGMIGTAGGITSLVSYLALLAVGVPPLAANVTNSIALLGSGSGAALRAGPDLVGHGRALRGWMAAMLLASLAGAVLLLLTSAGVFDHVVPFLVAVGSLALLGQPWIAARLSRRGGILRRATALSLGVPIGVYNGYFGAGSGILVLTLMLLTTDPVLHRANALKNVIIFSADILPAVLFAVFGTVVWHAVWPLGLGALGGGLVGPTIARRVRPSLMRGLIAGCGLTLALWLGLHS